MSDFPPPVLLLCEKHKPFDYINHHDRIYILAFLQLALAAHLVKNLPTMQETWVRSLGQEDPLEKEMATNSSILAWKIPWTEEPGGIQSMGSPRVRYNLATKLPLHWLTTYFLQISPNKTPVVGRKMFPTHVSILIPGYALH